MKAHLAQSESVRRAADGGEGVGSAGSVVEYQTLIHVESGERANATLSTQVEDDVVTSKLKEYGGMCTIEHY